MANTYSSADARRIVGLHQRHLDYWREREIVSPSEQSTRGSKEVGRGTQRRYSFDDLIRLKIVKKLRLTGLSIENIRKALKALKKRQPGADLLTEILVTDGKRFEWRRADGRVEDLLAGGQLVFTAFALGSVENEVRARILPAPRRRAVAKRRNAKLG